MAESMPASMYRGGAARTGVFPAHGGAGPAARWRARGAGWIKSSPVVWNGAVYFTSLDGGVHAAGARAGEPRWSRRVSGAVDCSPAADGGLVFTASADGTVHALDAATGSPRWTHVSGQQGGSSPAVAGGVVYIGGPSGTLLALDAATGALNWVYQEEIPELTDGPTGLSPSGRPVESSPAVDGRTVYQLLGWRLCAVDAASGSLRWAAPVQSTTTVSPAAASGTVYLAEAGGVVCAFDAATGRDRWRSDVGPVVFRWGTPAVAGDTVLVCGELRPSAGGHRQRMAGGVLLALDAATGSVRWHHRARSPAEASPAAAAGVAYLATRGGLGHRPRITALDLASGELRWSQWLPPVPDGVPGLLAAGVVSAPSLAGGLLYLGLPDGDLLALPADGSGRPAGLARLAARRRDAELSRVAALSAAGPVPWPAGHAPPPTAPVPSPAGTAPPPGAAPPGTTTPPGTAPPGIAPPGTAPPGTAPPAPLGTALVEPLGATPHGPAGAVPPGIVVPGSTAPPGTAPGSYVAAAPGPSGAAAPGTPTPGTATPGTPTSGTAAPGTATPSPGLPGCGGPLEPGERPRLEREAAQHDETARRARAAGDFAAALRHSSDGIAVVERLLTAVPGDVPALTFLAGMLYHHAALLDDLGQAGPAADDGRRALEICERLAAAGGARYATMTADARARLGWLLARAGGDHAEVRRLAASAVAGYRELATAEPAHQQYQAGLCRVLCLTARALHQIGDVPGALAAEREAVAAFRHRGDRVAPEEAPSFGLAALDLGHRLLVFATSGPTTPGGATTGPVTTGPVTASGATTSGPTGGTGSRATLIEAHEAAADAGRQFRAAVTRGWGGTAEAAAAHLVLAACRKAMGRPHNEVSGSFANYAYLVQRLAQPPPREIASLYQNVYALLTALPGEGPQAGSPPTGGAPGSPPASGLPVTGPPGAGTTATSPPGAGTTATSPPGAGSTATSPPSGTSAPGSPPGGGPAAGGR